MRHYCTHFDSNYLSRGLALHASLRRHAAPFRLWVLPLDAACQESLGRLALPEVVTLPIPALESAFPALRDARGNRTLVEYYFTCFPFLPLHLLRAHPGIDRLSYLDADLFFYASPEVLYGPADPPIGIVPHRFPPHLPHLERYGLYNSGWLDFRRAPQTFACLERWADQCLAWCHERPENGQYGDQRYLEEWPSLYPVRILDHPGANLGRWNLGRYAIQDSPEGVRVDGSPLIFFHFSGLRELAPGLYDPALEAFGARLTPVLRRSVYLPYLRCLREVGTGSLASVRRPSRNPRQTAHACLDLASGILTRRYLLAP